MADEFTQIRLLLQEKADCQARLSMIPYEGTPEIKENESGKYLYMRKRIAGRLTSVYVGIYSPELHQLLLKNSQESRLLHKQIRKIDKKLAEFGYLHSEISLAVLRNLDFARANMKANIYDQAVLEGVATSFPQTENIIDNGTVSGMSAGDIQKILNLKHAWEFILDPDIIQAKSDYYLLCHIAKLVNEGFFIEGGRIRTVTVTIGGCSYVPPIPLEIDVKDKISAILASGCDDIDIAVELCLYSMKTQIFLDGNKRASVIFANHYLIAHGQGFLVIPECEVPEFKQLLVSYYEGTDPEIIKTFLRNKCLKKMEE